MAQYVDEFSQLARYARRDVATNATKQEKFLEGLNNELSFQLTMATFNSYRELVDKAIIPEGKQLQMENHKREYRQGRYNFGVQQKPRYTLYS